MKKDISGQRFGKLVAVHPIGKTVAGNTIWLFACNCGNEIQATEYGAKNLRTGCIKCFTPGMLRHGHSYGHSQQKSGRTREYTSWLAMKGRCLNPKASGFHHYGGAGITIDPEWIASFEAFLRDLGPRPSSYTLDRVDPHGNYTKENTRWATTKQQNRNRRKTTRVTIDGRITSLAEVCERHGIGLSTARARLKRGLTGRAVFTPPPGKPVGP